MMWTTRRRRAWWWLTETMPAWWYLVAIVGLLLLAFAATLGAQTPCEGTTAAVSRANTVFADLPSQDESELQPDGSTYYVTAGYEVRVFRDGVAAPIQTRQNIPRAVWTLVTGTCYRTALANLVTLSTLAGGKPHRLFLLPWAEYEPADAGAYSNWFCLTSGKCSPKAPATPGGLTVMVTP